MTIEFSDDLYEQIEVAAKVRGMDAHAFVIEAVRLKLAREIVQPSFL